MALRLSQFYKPPGITGRVHYWISPYSRNRPIVLFRTRADAEAWAREQPADIVGGVDMVASLDWMLPNDNPREVISRTRSIVDLR